MEFPILTPEKANVTAYNNGVSEIFFSNLSLPGPPFIEIENSERERLNLDPARPSFEGMVPKVENRRALEVECRHFSNRAIYNISFITPTTIIQLNRPIMESNFHSLRIIKNLIYSKWGHSQHNGRWDGSEIVQEIFPFMIK